MKRGYAKLIGDTTVYLEVEGYFLLERRNDRSYRRSGNRCDSMARLRLADNRVG